MEISVTFRILNINSKQVARHGLSIFKLILERITSKKLLEEDKKLSR